MQSPEVMSRLSVQIPARMALSFPSHRSAADTSHFCRNDSQTFLQPGDVFKLQECPTATQGEVGPSCKPIHPSWTVPESFRSKPLCKGLKCTWICPYVHFNQIEYLLFPVLYYSNVLGGVCLNPRVTQISNQYFKDCI